jgi:hypothetical protein
VAASLPPFSGSHVPTANRPGAHNSLINIKNLAGTTREAGFEMLYQAHEPRCPAG